MENRRAVAAARLFFQGTGSGGRKQPRCSLRNRNGQAEAVVLFPAEPDQAGGSSCAVLHKTGLGRRKQPRCSPRNRIRREETAARFIHRTGAGQAGSASRRRAVRAGQERCGQDVCRSPPQAAPPRDGPRSRSAAPRADRGRPRPPRCRLPPRRAKEPAPERRLLRGRVCASSRGPRSWDGSRWKAGRPGKMRGPPADRAAARAAAQ